MAGNQALLTELLPHWKREHGDEPIGIGCEDGWHPLIETLHRQIAALAPDYGLREVFQKYGVLVYRVSRIGEARQAEVDACIDAARDRSRTVCERCGDAGQLCRDPAGWLQVVCPRHQDVGGCAPCLGVDYVE